MMQIEVIVQHATEAVEAEKLGVDRLELVSAIDEGGLTPSSNVINEVLRRVTIPVQVMIRPHSNSFHYDETDMNEVLSSIKRVVDMGGNRIVFGAITKDGTIDEKAIEKVISAYPELDITFHKAFDEVINQTEAYTILEKYPQIKRILTSGGTDHCVEGKNQLKKLVELSMAKKGPSIMPGAGLDPENIASIDTDVQANQYHFGKAVRERTSYDYSFSKQALATIGERLGHADTKQLGFTH